MRSEGIAARCREIALRVDASGEWGELGETLREAAAEVERLRLTDEERDAINEIVGQHEGYLPSSVTFGGTTAESLVVRKMLYRLGGGE